MVFVQTLVNVFEFGKNCTGEVYAPIELSQTSWGGPRGYDIWLWHWVTPDKSIFEKINSPMTMIYTKHHTRINRKLKNTYCNIYVQKCAFKISSG